MTHYPKYPSGKYSIEVGFPGDKPNTVIDYVDTMDEVDVQLKSLVTRTDICRAIASPMPGSRAAWKETYVINQDNCTHCGKENCVGALQL